MKIDVYKRQPTSCAELSDTFDNAFFKSEEDRAFKPAWGVGIPTRLDLAGTWIDQPYVSMHHPGWAITISLEPTDVYKRQE